MNLAINAIKDGGILDKERLVFRVLKEDDIGRYVVFSTISSTEDSVSTKVRHTYWFPDKIVRSGDYIVLHTKSGTQSESLNKAGTTTHFFYWKLDKTIWNQKEDYAVLLEVKDWITKGAFE